MDFKKCGPLKSASSKSRSKGSKRQREFVEVYTEGPILSGRLSSKPKNSNGTISRKSTKGKQGYEPAADSKGTRLKQYINQVPSFFKNDAPTRPREHRKKMTPVSKRSHDKLKSSVVVHHTEVPQARPAELLPFQFQTHETGRTHELSEMLDNRTVQKLPLDIIQNLECLKLNSERNREHVSGRRPLRVSLRDQYDELSRQFGKSVMLSKKGESCSNSLQRPREEWKEENLPLTPDEVLTRFPHYLTRDERREIKQYDEIYFIGHRARKRQQIGQGEVNYDTPDAEYNYLLNDHLAYRYELVEFLGKGSYGQVFKVYDHKKKEMVALKIIKNKRRYSNQSQIEIKILLAIRENDPENTSNIVKIKDFLRFRGHMCIIFELLCENLYELIKRNGYNGLDMEPIRRFAIQILVSLKFLRERKIIHCDLKPQNILLKQSNKTGIKIIDFGSSCYEHEIIYSYIQSRYYRAPEITLDMGYNTMIDMWSFGCILAELYLGQPLFIGDNEFEQMNYLVGTLGPPPRWMTKQSKRGSRFFNDDMTFTEDMKSAKLNEHFGKKLRQLIPVQEELFLEFLEEILRWDPRERLNPKEALSHEWVLQGMPEDVRNAHIAFQDASTLKRANNLFQNRSRDLKKKSKSREREGLIESKSKSKSRSKQISVRLKETSKNEECLRRENHSIPMKIKLSLETKTKMKGESEPKTAAQISRPKKSREFFRQK